MVPVSWDHHTEAKALEKIKVFRIDGIISDDEWSRLIGLFFQENSMVAEYLNPNYLTEG
jgi:hypothetical protein